MAKKRLFFTALTIMIFLSAKAWASEAGLQEQLDELKKQMKEMSYYYEAKIAELEARFAQQERRAPEKGTHDEHIHKYADEVSGQGHHHGLLGDKVKLIGALDARFHNVEGKDNSLFIHEAKIGAQADITDELSGFITFTKHHGEEMELEEGYARLKFDELRLQVKPGKFFVNFGPENLAHFFDRRTITLSAMHEGLFGHEPWSDAGVQLDWKVPVDFYSNVSFAVVNGDNAASFGDGEDTVSNDNFPIVLDWTNVFKTEYGLFKLGPSFSWGKWDSDGKYDVYLVGGNLYYKTGNFDAQAEFIYRDKETGPDTTSADAYGYYTWAAYTIPFNSKYLKGLEFLGGFGQFVPDTSERETRFTPQIALIFNDYAKLRATYEIRKEGSDNIENNSFIMQFMIAF